MKPSFVAALLFLFTLFQVPQARASNLYLDQYSDSVQGRLNSNNLFAVTSSIEGGEGVTQADVDDEFIKETKRTEAPLSFKFTYPNKIMLSLGGSNAVDGFTTMSFDTAQEAKFFVELLVHLSARHKITLLNHGWTLLLDGKDMLHVADVFHLVLDRYSNTYHRVYHATVDHLTYIQDKTGKPIPMMGTYPPRELFMPTITRDSLTVSMDDLVREVGELISSREILKITPEPFALDRAEKRKINMALRVFLRDFTSVSPELKRGNSVKVLSSKVEAVARYASEYDNALSSSGRLSRVALKCWKLLNSF